jgi:hypothetical protein
VPGARGTTLVVLLVVPLIGILDAARIPDSSWRAADQSKIAWIVVQALGSVIGVGAYLVLIRPKLRKPRRPM